MKKIIAALCMVQLSCFAMNEKEVVKRTLDSLELTAQGAERQAKALERLAQQGERQTKALELFAITQAMKNCTQIEASPYRIPLMAKSWTISAECKSMTEAYIEQMKKNQNNS